MTTQQKEKIDWYRNLNRYINKGGILFAGSTFVSEFPINELEVNYQLSDPVYNRGIRGFTVSEMSMNLDTCILDLKPSKLFLAMGEEDCKRQDFSLDAFLDKYEEILTRIDAVLPDCSVYIIGLLPTCGAYETTNRRLRHLALDKQCNFLDFSLVLLNQKETLLLEGKSDSLSPASYITILKEMKHLFRTEDMGFGEVWNMISNWY